MQDGSVSPIRAFFRNKWVRLILAVDILVIVLIIVLIVNKVAKTVVIDFMVAPIDATITIDGKGGYRNGGEAYSLTPGTHEIQITHPDLNTKIFNLDLKANYNITITAFLSKDGNFDFYKLRENFESFNTLASIASAQNNQTTDHDTSAENFIHDFQRNYDFYSNWLPITYSDYDDNNKLTKYVSVRQGYNCSMTLCLEVVMSEESDKTIANSLIQGRGFNLEDFEIEYRTH